MGKIPNKITTTKWSQYWSGHWSVLSCSIFGDQYFGTLKANLGFGFGNDLFIIKGEHSSCYKDLTELIEFRKKLAKDISKDEKIGVYFANQLKEKTDSILIIMDGLRKKPVNFENFLIFKKAFYEYVSPHLFVKNGPEMLPEKLKSKLLPVFMDARLHSEKVYSETEKFLEWMAGIIGKKEKMPPELLLCLTAFEFEDYLLDGKTPRKEQLIKRHVSTALYFEEGKLKLFSGDEVKTIEEGIHGKDGISKLHGTIAYSGRAIGVAKIVLDPTKASDFDPGNILITGMTRPEYLVLMKKASAIVTDAGGILSHAAIIARELKKPCLIGTQKATKIYKDGDLVEVDAIRGTIRKIK